MKVDEKLAVNVLMACAIALTAINVAFIYITIEYMNTAGVGFIEATLAIGKLIMRGILFFVNIGLWIFLWKYEREHK